MLSDGHSRHLISVRLELVGPEVLKEHEEVDLNVLQKTQEAIRALGVVKRPIIADSRTLVVLDGVHRLNALKQLRCTRVPVYLIDYQSEEVLVFSSHDGMSLSKKDVIDAALSGRKYPPKTTNHMIRMADGDLRHISWVEGEINIPLAILQGELVRGGDELPQDSKIVCGYCNMEFESEGMDAHLFAEHGIAV
jgi:hypothetical protein